MSRRKSDGKEVAGRIITICFILFIAAVVWFLVSLFKEKEISISNLSGQWKLAGSPVVYYNFAGEDYDDVLKDIHGAIEQKKVENERMRAKNSENIRRNRRKVDDELDSAVILGKGVMSTYTKKTGTNNTSDYKEYDFVLTAYEYDNAGTIQTVYRMKFTNRADKKDQFEWGVNSVSRAQMNIKGTANELTALTKVNVF